MPLQPCQSLEVKNLFHKYDDINIPEIDFDMPSTYRYLTHN